MKSILSAISHRLQISAMAFAIKKYSILKNVDLMEEIVSNSTVNMEPQVVTLVIKCTKLVMDIVIIVHSRISMTQNVNLMVEIVTKTVTQFSTL